jgi:hypothetical protein
MTIVARAMVPVVALWLGYASVAGAQDVYTACSKNRNGREKVRAGSILVNQSPICKDTETPRTWNEEGPQGPPGFSSCAPEEILGSAPANSFGVLIYTCSSGMATGNGAIWSTPFDGADNGTFYFFPRNANTTTIVAYNHTGSASNFRFFVQCCQ